ncbi:MAG: hypothetical protein M3376_02905 [Actinomycetota bacterium]|nr:hypothetical protein [Actinomycetota bacterium]
MSLTKLACKVPGLEQICKWTLGRLEDEVIKPCQKATNTCKRLVGKVCKIGGRLCDVARRISCLVVDVFCKRGRGGLPLRVHAPSPKGFASTKLLETHAKKHADDFQGGFASAHR